MPQLPDEDDTPFSLPRDVPEIVPVDYPELDASIDPHEAYDEGIDDSIDTEPYSFDDDPVKATKRAMNAGVGGKEKFTANHDVIRRWAENRHGHPAHIVGIDDGLDKGGLYIHFEDTEPEVEVETISWVNFFKIFDKNKLALLYKSKLPSGTESRFYRFVDRVDASRITQARQVM